jgi:transducin (beta)-like 1
MSLSSDELNVLVYRYLLESGFAHSAFAFSSEAHLNKVLNAVQTEHVAPGSLIAYVQKGLQFDEIEAHVNEDGTEVLCDQPFSVLYKHECKIKSKRKLFDPDGKIDLLRFSCGYLLLFFN